MVNHLFPKAEEALSKRARRARNENALREPFGSALDRAREGTPAASDRLSDHSGRVRAELDRIFRDSYMHALWDVEGSTQGGGR